MLDLRNFTELSNSALAAKEETYIYRIQIASKVHCTCRVSLGDSACSEVIKFIGNQVRVLASDEGEVIIARGDRRLSVLDSGRGYISVSRLLPIIEKKFPNFKRVPMSCRWEQDGYGHKVFLLTPTGTYERQERPVVGMRLEDKR